MPRWVSGLLLVLGISCAIFSIYALNLFIDEWNTWSRAGNVSDNGFAIVTAFLGLAIIVCLFMNGMGAYYWVKHENIDPQHALSPSRS